MLQRCRQGSVRKVGSKDTARNDCPVPTVPNGCGHNRLSCLETTIDTGVNAICRLHVYHSANLAVDRHPPGQGASQLSWNLRTRIFNA